MLRGFDTRFSWLRGRGPHGKNHSGTKTLRAIQGPRLTSPQGLGPVPTERIPPAAWISLEVPGRGASGRWPGCGWIRAECWPTGAGMVTVRGPRLLHWPKWWNPHPGTAGSCVPSAKSLTPLCTLHGRVVRVRDSLVHRTGFANRHRQNEKNGPWTVFSNTEQIKFKASCWMDTGKRRPPILASSVV